MAASYPGAVKTFTSRSAGQTIEPSHVNDLQDEVNAIESGILNGTAPLTSSNTSVNTLQVSSNSTFAVRPLMPPPEIAMVGLESTVTIGSSGASTLAWTRDIFVQNSSMHSTGTNPERLIPQTTGVYFFAAEIGFSAAGNGVRQVIIQDSSGGAIGSGLINESTAAVVTVGAVGYKRYDAVGGYATVRLVLSGNSTLSISTGSRFTMEKR